MKRNIPIFKYDDAWQILARGERLNGLVIDAGSEEVMLPYFATRLQGSPCTFATI